MSEVPVSCCKSNPEDMTQACPFCAASIVAEVLVCPSCSRDVAVPRSLLAERDDLVRKCDLVREALGKAKAELAGLKRNRKPRPA
jgi:hypothetical protein